MGILTAIRDRFAGPRRTDFYGLAKRVRHVPPAELAVAEAALQDGDPILQRFVWQLREAPDVWRLIAEDGSYELRVSTTKVVRDVPRSGWRSPSIPVRSQGSGRRLEIQLVASIAGIIEIHGRALDNQPWPAEWSIASDDLATIRSQAPWLRVPTPAELSEQRARAIEAIESWLGGPGLLRGKRGIVSVEPPATNEAIAGLSAAQRFELPVAYRDLLLVANGFEIGRAVVLGTDDAYRLDIPGPDRLVIAPPDTHGAIVLAPSGEVRLVDLEDDTSDGQVRAPDLRTWVQQQIGSRRSLQS